MALPIYGMMYAFILIGNFALYIPHWLSVFYECNNYIKVDWSDV